MPFFEANPLVTAKWEDFLKFREILSMMERRLHLSVEGLRRIAAVQQNDEPAKAVSFSGILRGHTPANSHRRES